ncbi:hypothetical protein BH20ACT6_BH20ACT6_25550 [soil metagenome]
MNEASANNERIDANPPAEERALRGTAGSDPLEIIEGLQSQIDDLTRTVERHQAILERLAANSEPPPSGA